MNPETCGHMPDHMGGVPPSGARVGLGWRSDLHQGHPPTEATTPPTEATTPAAEGVTINEPPNRAISEGTPKETEDEVSRLSAEVKRLSDVVFEQNGRLAALEAILHPDARDGRVFDLERRMLGETTQQVFDLEMRMLREATQQERVDSSQNCRLGALFGRLGELEDRLDDTDIVGHTTEGFPFRLAR